MQAGPNTKGDRGNRQSSTGVWSLPCSTATAGCGTLLECWGFSTLFRLGALGVLVSDVVGGGAHDIDILEVSLVLSGLEAVHL